MRGLGSFADGFMSRKVALRAASFSNRNRGRLGGVSRQRLAQDGARPRKGPAFARRQLPGHFSRSWFSRPGMPSCFATDGALPPAGWRLVLPDRSVLVLAMGSAHRRGNGRTWSISWICSAVGWAARSCWHGYGIGYARPALCCCCGPPWRCAPYGPPSPANSGSFSPSNFHRCFRQIDDWLTLDESSEGSSLRACRCWATFRLNRVMVDCIKIG